LTSTTINDQPIAIGYDWPGVELNFPPGYLASGASVRADLRRPLAGDGFALNSDRAGDVVTLSADAADTADLKEGHYRADLVLVGADATELSLDTSIVVPVVRLVTEPA
jgi:hypothetical protein